ncbi:helix-turn-helix domain-containing protein [Parachitinimonas caeni]|uniref:Helix-turn-helix transcriptional regulator n=1 Tax=Parachitinimonas caeni TaxID=3031301 RepID=A0ABT7DWT0_9NEIS|nr:helix-turn-helix transcriptional regulator [Parachitinimonas caeni]MDK2123548.1 helix-turn-helix transcriptional regulator [Parachitinimonas caeni]
MSLLEFRHLTHDAPQEAALHTHAEGQLFTVEAGMVSVETETGRWVMPPGCLGWLPPALPHGAAVHGNMRGLSLYFTQDWSRNQMPGCVKIVRLTPLLSALLDSVTTLPASRLQPYLTVFADAFCHEPAQTLFLPMPTDSRLIMLATLLLAQPDDSTDLDGWATRVGMSRRTLTRRFQQETGWSIGQWRQQLCLQRALEQLAAGESVTRVALNQGYQSVSAFISMFRRYLGTTPSVWTSI